MGVTPDYAPVAPRIRAGVTDTWDGTVAVDRFTGERLLVATGRRADLLLAATLGINIAARSGAFPAELRRIVSGIQGQIRSWT